jgi:transcriptional regulator with XRE-family HTH domain
VPRDTSITDSPDLTERWYERLRRMLDRAGISNPALAARAGVTNESVSRWRSGKQAIADAELRVVIAMLAEAGIHVTIGWMRYGEVATIAMPDPTQDRKLTDVEEQRALRTAAERQEKPEKRAKGPKRSRGR